MFVEIVLSNNDLSAFLRFNKVYMVALYGSGKKRDIRWSKVFLSEMKHISATSSVQEFVCINMLLGTFWTWLKDLDTSLNNLKKS